MATGNYFLTIYLPIVFNDIRCKQTDIPCICEYPSEVYFINLPLLLTVREILFSFMEVGCSHFDFSCFGFSSFRVRVMVFYATFNNISAISWQSVLLVKKPEKPTDLLQVTEKRLSSYQVIISMLYVYMYVVYFVMYDSVLILLLSYGHHDWLNKVYLFLFLLYKYVKSVFNLLGIVLISNKYKYIFLPFQQLISFNYIYQYLIRWLC